MKTNQPTEGSGGMRMPEHWQRLSAKIAQVGERIAREIRRTLVASGVDPRSLDNPDGTLDDSEEKARMRRRNRPDGNEPTQYRPIG